MSLCNAVHVSEADMQVSEPDMHMQVWEVCRRWGQGQCGLYSQACNLDGHAGIGGHDAGRRAGHAVCMEVEVVTGHTSRHDGLVNSTMHCMACSRKPEPRALQCLCMLGRHEAGARYVLEMEGT